MQRLFYPPLLVIACLGSLWSVECVPATSPNASAMWSNLSLHQQMDLADGKPVVLEEEVPGNTWPRYTVYQIVASSAEQAAAVFWDCELDPKYIPNCLSVKITAKPQPWTCEAEYTLKMPMMLPSEVYVSRNELNIPNAGCYEISWKVLHARYIKGSIGNLRIEPLGKDQIHCASGEHSLMRYTNLVMPGSSIAGLLQSTARSEVIESVQALVTQIEQETEKSSQLLQQQLQKMESSLKSLTLEK